MIRVMLPSHLRTLASTGTFVDLDVQAPVTQVAVLDALEAEYPMLRGNIRDVQSKRRRPMVRFFACEQDLSHHAMDDPLPDRVVTGEEPFLIIGAISGG